MARSVIRWLNALRSRIGLRRLPDGLKWDYVPAPARGAEQDDDPEAFRRALPYGLGAAAFAVVVFVVFWAYGMAASAPTALETTGSRELVLRAMELLREGDAAGAARVREELRQQHGSDATVHFLDGYLLAATGDEGAGRAAQLTRSSWPRRRAARNLVTLAGYREATGDADGAIEALTRAAALRPKDPGIRLFRAAALLTAGRAQEAVAEADELERRLGPNAAVFLIRGHARLEAGRPDLARRDFKTGLLYTTSSPRMTLGLTEALIRLGEYDRAGTYAESLLRYDPGNVRALLALGIARENSDDIEGAEEAYRRAVEAAPQHVAALNNLAYLLVSGKDAAAEALPYAERAHELAPDAGHTADTLGWIHLRLGHLDRALPLLRRAHAALPEHPEVSLHLAEALLAGGSREEAVALLRRLAARGEQAAPFSDEARGRLDAMDTD